MQFRSDGGTDRSSSLQVSHQSSRESRMVGLALLPEPRPKAGNLPTRYGARDEGAQANRIRHAGPARRCAGTKGRKIA